MLKLTLRPGEFIDIGENVRVIFSGGSANNIHLLVDECCKKFSRKEKRHDRTGCRQILQGKWYF